MADRGRHPRSHNTANPSYDPPDRSGRDGPVSHPRDGQGDRAGRPAGPPTGSQDTPIFPFKEEYDENRQALYNLRYTLSSRGLCQLLEIFVNLLLVICAGVPYSNAGGYRDLASLGGLYEYYYGGANAFSGADAARVKELDQLFHRLKRPPYVFTMACAGALMAYACAMLALGVFRVSYRCPPVLLGEALVNGLIALGYIPALAFYFIKLKQTYDSPICKEREEMYAKKGHQGFKCQYNGADIAGGLFAILGVVIFAFGAVLAIRAFRSVRNKKRSRKSPRPEESMHYV